MIGKRIKNYQIEELLGEGGMGVVYRARDLSLDRLVAIKMLHPEMLHQPDLLKRFKNEAYVTARLSHPNIAILYNFFTEENLHCLVMEYVNGKTLEEILSVHKQLPGYECIRILQQLFEGLNEAHKNEVLHRDIKPGNVMINQSGYVKLMDFGVARLENSARITRMNRVIGTLEYMAPELLTGGKPSVQTDLYSVGVTLYEMFFGKLPYIADSDSDIIEMIMKGKIPFPVEKKQTMFTRSNSIVGIINGLLHKNSKKRYASAREVLDDLTEFKISGRVSIQLLSNEKILQESGGAQRHKLFSLPVNIKSISSAARISFDSFGEIKPRLKAVFQTLEGKIIGVAVGFALIIMLLAGIFSEENGDSFQGSRDSTEQRIQMGDSESSAGSGQPIQANSSAIGNNLPQQNNFDDLAPVDPIVVPRQKERKSPREENNQVAAEEIETDQPTHEMNITDTDENTTEMAEDRVEPVQEEESTSRKSETARKIMVEVSGQFVEGIFDETISTATHTPGQQFYLVAAGPVYSDGYKIIESGARIRGIVSKVRTRGNARRAFLSVTFEAVQAVDGSWLPISYPEYSNQATGNVLFEKGRTIRRLRLESGRVAIPTN